MHSFCMWESFRLKHLADRSYLGLDQVWPERLGAKDIGNVAEPFLKERWKTFRAEVYAVQVGS